ncbi:RlpA-like double-psi beta-barrel-protein domain-containing protein-containing protein [Podospora fimiseda]|uniref:Cellulase n=1 Tax=Podospora fimiseda TaxID=252190 RepID=A0AAN7BMG6_9PEZI|nr:RlpA-like double-psi beta-barrel-protein domain-containing protein-containing protein [Podospora fimiseda]
MRSTSILSTSLLAALPLTAQAASGSGKSTRYWDCCKPSCSWPGKAAVSAPVFACDANFNRISDPGAKSGCDGGSAYSCADHSPWAINDSLAYGFAATRINGGSEASWCCACYALTFTSGPVAGKTMVVQSTSTGGDLGTNHFDLNMPGGGVGLFDGCRPQFGGLPGATYGGISDRSQCASFPNALKPGCEWRFDWFKNADNPDFTFTQVQCPSELVARTGCKRADDGNFPAFSPPSGGGSNPQPNPQPTSTQGGGGSSPTGCVAAKWAQCGGIGFTGCKNCEAGSTCKANGDYYSQCV